MLSAQVEAVLDLSDEAEVGEALPASWHDSLAALSQDLEAALARPPAERLKDGVRVVIAGPPNSGSPVFSMRYVDGMRPSSHRSPGPRAT